MTTWGVDRQDGAIGQRPGHQRPEPYFQDEWLTVLEGDCREVMAGMEPESVHCVVTSPPYWGLRDYGTATWEGGDAACDHTQPVSFKSSTLGASTGGRSVETHQRSIGAQATPYRKVCSKCGATRIDAQLGLEPTPEEYVETLVDVFREVRRVLRADGTVWLNLGDSYANDTKWGGSSGGKHVTALHGNTGIGRGKRDTGLAAKQLVGIPWRVAFALQADGWYLRSDIIWAKPNPMPESVTDRPTKSHEYVFLLSKSARYFYDADAVRESAVGQNDHDLTGPGYAAPGQTPQTGSRVVKREPPVRRVTEETVQHLIDGGASADLVGFARSKVDKQAAAVAHGIGNGHHIAGFNDRWDQSERKQTRRAVELAEAAGLTQAHIDAIRAVGITDVGKARTTQSGTGKNDPTVQALADEAKAALGGYYREFLLPSRRNLRSVWTVATAPYPGAHFATFPPRLVEPCIKAGCPARGTVLDPFAGTGTVGIVAAALSRRAVLIDLNAEYLRQCLDRNRQMPLGVA